MSCLSLDPQPGSIFSIGILDSFALHLSRISWHLVLVILGVSTFLKITNDNSVVTTWWQWQWPWWWRPTKEPSLPPTFLRYPDQRSTNVFLLDWEIFETSSMPPSKVLLLLVRLRSWTTCWTEVRLASSPNNESQISTVQTHCHHLLLWRGCQRASQAGRRKAHNSPPSSRPASCCHREEGFWKVAAGRKPPLSSCPAPVQQEKKLVFINVGGTSFMKPGGAGWPGASLRVEGHSLLGPLSPPWSLGPSPSTPAPPPPRKPPSIHFLERHSWTWRHTRSLVKPSSKCPWIQLKFSSTLSKIC